MSILEALQDDITKLDVDAIVNAANSSLAGGGGVDGAIHRAAGPDLLTECLSLDGCPAGEARLTKGYRLKAKYVIHTVGPIYRGGASNEASTLAACYRNSLALAEKHGIRTLAFPAISTGVYGYPKKEAAEIAVAAVRQTIAEKDCFDHIIFCCFSAQDHELYLSLLALNK
jgi:O-acetyl-ADP-ribose deacetylase (regulator of RNase III)